MKIRFLSLMGSIVVVDSIITGIFILISQRLDVLAYDLSVNFLILGLANVMGAWWMFRPIQRFLDSGKDENAAIERAENLPRLSSIWAIVCTLAYCGAAFAMGVFTPGTLDQRDISDHVLVGGAVWFALAYAVYYGFYIYFVINDYSLDLKSHLRLRGLQFRARKGRIAHKLVAAMLVVAAMPSLLILFDLGIFRPVREAQGLSVEQTIFLDLIASSFLVAVSLIFVTRSLLRPIEALAETVQQLGKGGLDVSAPVLSGDELGQLAERFNGMIEGLREREFIRETFGRFVPRNVANTLLEQRGALEPQLRTATILFVDIENFTQIAEGHPPETVFRMLNDYFTEATKPINRYGGVVNQFQGDAILVTFNVPATDARHADNAVAAGIALLQAVQGREFAGIPLRVRIGIHTGEVIGGAVGSNDRLSYTVHGDAVNLASRLEHLNKKLGTSMLVSESTVKDLQGTYALEKAGDYALRGKSVETGVYALTGFA